jgi:ATP-dependent phosphofructokinase / diphosphate-dependent phosphofructokinase
MKTFKLAINTGGGDAPGLNAAIRAATLAGIGRGWEVWGISHGYGSFTDPNTRQLIQLDRERVRGITLLGGTILGTANRGNPFEMPIKHEDGSISLEDYSDLVVDGFKKAGLDALIAMGGDGSMAIANKLIQKGIPIVGVPKTIDNDLPRTDATLGFDTAVNIATEAIDRISTTAEAHERIMVVEVMGRYAGWIAMHAGLSATADIILLPEIPFSFDSMVKKVQEREAQGRHFTIVVAAEGAKQKEGSVFTKGKVDGQSEQLGGVAEFVSKRLSELTGKESRHMVLGHLQRGGSPSTLDRLISLRLGAAAVRAVEDGDFGKIVMIQDGDIVRVPINDIAGKMKYVPLDSDTVLTARELGISLGD